HGFLGAAGALAGARMRGVHADHALRAPTSRWPPSHTANATTVRPPGCRRGAFWSSDTIGRVITTDQTPSFHTPLPSACWSGLTVIEPQPSAIWSSTGEATPREIGFSTPSARAYGRA